MKKTIFTGSATAIITPMYADGSVNYEKLYQLIDFQIENDTDAIVICGTTGESSTLTHVEHCKVIDECVKHVNGRIPVIAGTGSNDTAYAIELSKEAKISGADALLSVTPYYNKTSQAGLIRHYDMIANAIEMPIILYDVPSRTGVSIKSETYLKLAQNPYIVAVKEASGNLSALVQTMALCGDELDVYSGNDDQIVPIMSLGGKGVISVFSNIMPKQCHQLTQYCLNGDFASAAKLQKDYIELINGLFCDVNPIPVKNAMNFMGLEVGPCRMPLVDLSEGDADKLKAIMAKYGLIK